MPTIKEQLQEMSEVVAKSEILIPIIEKFLPIYIEAVKNDKKIFTCGNGGSAADALHMAEEFTGRYRSNRRALPAICLNADVTAITCIANDWDYNAVFSRQLEALGREGDILVAFTSSGNSPNILRALEVAKERKITTLLLTGKDGGACREKADFTLIVPSQNTARIQEVHTWVLHVLLEEVEALNLF